MLDVTCVVPSPIKGQSYDVTHDGSGWRKDVVNQSWEFGFLPPYTSSPRWPLGAAEVYLFPPPPPKTLSPAWTGVGSGGTHKGWPGTGCGANYRNPPGVVPGQGQVLAGD